MPVYRVRLPVFMVLIALCQPGAAGAAESEIVADQFTAREEGSVVEAVGNVRLRSGDRILTADRIVYRYAVGRIFAEGQVTLTDADGTVHSVERVELTEDLRAGAFEALRSQFAAGGVLAAGSARRTRGDRTDFRDVTYTRCESCPDAGDPPPWQVRAGTATHEAEQQSITYRDVLLEAFGVPVIYLPWARFKDSTVERARGFLLPAVRSDRALGLVVETPYFLPLGPSQDLLLRTGYATQEGPLLGGVWRRAGISSDYRVEASVTHGSRARADGTRTRELRGHLFARGAIGLADGWSVGWDASRASDASYLARYGLGRGINVLSQYGYLRKRGDRLDADFEVYGFQNLSVLSQDDRVPTIFPRARVHWSGGPTLFGGRVIATGDAMALAQDDGRRNRRLSLETRWERSFPRNSGYVLDAVLRLRADAFDVRAGESDIATPEHRFVRVAPAAELGWRFPLMRRFAEGLMVVEPVVQALAAPEGLNRDPIPNTDSVDVELSHASLFEPNRFPGLDRIEGGVRLNMGVRGTYQGQGGVVARGTIGRVLRLTDERDFDQRSGLADRFSDLVGDVTVRIKGIGAAYWNFRRSPAVTGVRHDQVGAEVRLGPVETGFTYVRLHDDPTSLSTASSEQLGTEVAWQVTPEWRVSGYHLRDLGRAAYSSTLKAGLVLSFRNECLDLSLNFLREPTRASDIPPSSSVGLKVTLLGF